MRFPDEPLALGLNFKEGDSSIGGMRKPLQKLSLLQPVHETRDRGLCDVELRTHFGHRDGTAVYELAQESQLGKGESGLGQELSVNPGKLGLDFSELAGELLFLIHQHSPLTGPPIWFKDKIIKLFNYKVFKSYTLSGRNARPATCDILGPR